MYSKKQGKLMRSKSETYDKHPVSYSIWFMPQGSVQDQLKNVIHSFNTDFGSPIFEPHVTLVSSFLGNKKDLLQKTENISKEIKPFVIFFDGIAYLPENFRALFLKVNFSLKLKTSRNIACENLRWKDMGYLPHLSLAYGNYSVKVKEKMVSTLDSLPAHFLANKIFLAHNDEILLKWTIIQGFELGV